jgi:hypothetical protein
VGQWLESSDGDKLVRDVEGFARRNPWAVAAGGLVLGLTASRFLKASSSERYRSSLSAEGDGGNSGRFQREESGGGEFTREEGSLISTEPRA